MGAAIGAGLGLLLGAGMGHLRAKHEQEAKAKEMEAELFKDIVAKNPHAIESPEFQKVFKKFYGDEGVQLISGINNMRKQAMAQAQQQGLIPGTPGGQMITGTGQPPIPGAGTSAYGSYSGVLPAGTTAGAKQPAAGTATSQEPQTVEQLREWIGHYDAKPDLIEGLPDHIQKRLEAKYKTYTEQLKELEKEQREPGLEAEKIRAKRPEELETAREKIPIEAAGAAARASAEAPIKIRTAAGEAAASTSARLGVETSDAAINAEAKKAAARAAAEFKAKRQAESGSAPTPKEVAELKGKLETRISGLIKNYSATHPAGWFGSGGTTSPEFKFYVATEDEEAARHMFAVPTGAVFKGEKIKSGSPVWRLPDGSAWTPD